MGTVYLIGNDVTKRFYVGKTDCGRFRIKEHFCALRGNRHIVEDMQEDFNMYGEASFFVRFLGEYRGEELKKMEVFMMKVLRSQDRRFGYNYKDKTGTSKKAIEQRWKIRDSHY